MKIVENQIEKELNRLEFAVSLCERQIRAGFKPFNNKRELMDKLIFTTADLQLISPKMEIDKNSPELKRLEAVGAIIQNMR